MKKESLNAIYEAYDIEQACIGEMKTHINEEQFAKAVDLLSKAPRIGTSGCGHSGIICQHMAHLMCCIERPSRFISPAEAVHYGFVNKAFPLETMDEELDKILDKLAATPPLAVKGLKEQLYLQENVGIEAAYRKEHDLCIGLMGSKDFQNAVKSFLKKEKPVFKGE